MADAISKPMRQLSAVLASAKAAVESLRSYEPAPRSKTDRMSGDDDMFV